MKRVVLICAVLSAVLTAVGAAAFDIPVERAIEPPKSYKKRTTWVTPVMFPHSGHARHTACGHCHHMETDLSTKNGEYMACSFCHNAAEEKGKTGFYGAWHAQSPKSCIGCHMTRPSDTEPVPPKGCTTGCHKHGEEKGETQ
jgi:hypothetical protein